MKLYTVTCLTLAVTMSAHAGESIEEIVVLGVRDTSCLDFHNRFYSGLQSNNNSYVVSDLFTAGSDSHLFQTWAGICTGGLK